MRADAVAVVLDRLRGHSPDAERRATSALVRLDGDAVAELRRALRTHPNANARAVAIDALARLAKARAGSDLRRALRDRATPVRQHALVALDHHAWTPRAAAGVTAALGDRSPGVRHFAARIAGRRRLGRARPALVRGLRDPVWHVRQQAAIALGEIRARAATTALRRATADDRPAVRLAARRALDRIGVRT